MNRWIWVLILWSTQAIAKPAMKAESVEAKLLSPSFICQTGPFEVSFTALEAKHGQQIRLDLESIATGASLKYQVSVGEVTQREGHYSLSSLSNTIDPCAPGRAPAPQTNSVTVASKAQTIGPVTMIPAPVTVTVVTPPQNAPLLKDQLVVSLPASIAAGSQVTLSLWAQKPIVVKSMQFSLEQMVPADPVAYAAWEAKQEAKAEARAGRLAKRESRQFARKEARAVKVAIKSQEREKALTAKAVTVSAQAAVSFEVKTQKASEKQVKLTARIERRQSRQERRELRLSIKREKRTPIKAARAERQKRHYEARFKIRFERRERRGFRLKERHFHRDIKMKDRRLAREPRLVIKTQKRWARYEAKDKKMVTKIGALQGNEQFKHDRLESRRYNLFMVNLRKVEGVYESLLTVDVKAQFKVALYDEAVSMKDDRETTYKLYVDARTQEKAQISAVKALETSVKTPEAVVAEVPARPEAPAPRTEMVGPTPASDASWKAGYWQWTGAQYIWIEGRWIFAQVQLPAVKILAQKEKKAPTKSGYTATKPK